MFAVRKATRANLPRRYTFSFVKLPPPKTPNASRPYFDCTPLTNRVIRSSASFQLAGTSLPFLRTSGERRRSGWFGSSSAARPFLQTLPCATGQRGVLRNPSNASRPSACVACSISKLHCTAQYGQVVSVIEGSRLRVEFKVIGLRRVCIMRGMCYMRRTVQCGTVRMAHPMLFSRQRRPGLAGSSSC